LLTKLPTLPLRPSDHGRSGRFPGPGYDRFRDRDRDRDLDKYDAADSRQLALIADSEAKNFVSDYVDPEYSTPEEAEAAFFKLLRRCAVQLDWSWEQTMPVVIKDPQYRAIKDPKDRKEAFVRFCREVVAQDKERAEERLAKLRTDFETMLRRHPEIKHYTRWKTARPMLEGETLFRTTDVESEREQLFHEYVAKLKKEHLEQQKAMRKSATEGLIHLLQTLHLEPYTRWADAHAIITASVPFKSEEMYQTLTKLDVLAVFQDHMKALERSFNDAKQHEKNQKYRKERKARDAFVELLKELRKKGKINARTKWKAVFPIFEKDERYLSMLGNPASTPMDLFWDAIEEEDRALRGMRNAVLDVFEVCMPCIVGLAQPASQPAHSWFGADIANRIKGLM